MKRIAVLALIGLIIAATVSGCKRSSKSAQDQGGQRNLGHFISKVELRRLMRDARWDLNLVAGGSEDSATLSRALNGTALKTMVDQIKAERAQGRIKKRRFKNIKLSIANYTKGIAGVTLTFIDASYYVGKNGAAITQPANTAEKRLLALKKIKGRWKIIALFNPGSRPTNKPAGQQPR